MRYYFSFYFILMFSNQLSAQFKIQDSCVAFVLHIEAKNFPSDTMLFSYNDCNDNVHYNDTIILSNNIATIRGKINRATEGVLSTNLHSNMLDGPRVIRFLIEPSEMTLRFDLINNAVQNIASTGSISQKEKEAFEKENRLLLDLMDYYFYDFLPEKLSVHAEKKDSILEKYHQEFSHKIEVLYELLAAKVLKYVREKPDSYYSGYLLNQYKRKIPIDSLQKYFVNLPSEIIYSDFGKNFLEEIFKVSNNQLFRERFADSALFEELNSIKTIFDISLLNPTGKKTSFSDFKGNYIVVDFWASWCGPCFANIPALKKLMMDMKNKPIKFISVSLDKNIDNWKKSIKEHDFPGINLFDENGLLSTFFKVLWVPRYVIIHPDGTVADTDAPYAINPKLEIILNELLEENKKFNK